MSTEFPVRQTSIQAARQDRDSGLGRPLVRLDGCAVRLAGRVILADVRLTLRAGQGLAVLGGNGAGKSTLLRLLRGDVWPTDPDCRAFYDPDEPGATSPSSSPIGFRERTALVSAEQAEEYRRLDHPLTGRECALTGLTNSRFLSGSIDPEHLARAEGLFRELGAEDLLERSVAIMSEGQAKTVLLVRALGLRPSVLFLDEAFDGLDAARRARAVDLAAELVAAGATLVQATHRPEELVPGLAMGLVLEGGRLAHAGELAAAVAIHAGGRCAWPGADKTGRPPEASGGPSRELPALPEPIVELRHVSVSLAGNPVLRDVNFALCPGEGWAVVGPNGAGKSTLLKVLTGDLHPLPGGLVLRGGRAGPHDLWQVRREVGCVSAEMQAWHDPDVAGLDAVASGFHGSVGLHVQAGPGEAEAAMELLERAGLAGLAGERLGRMSFGQRRKLMILRALIHKPKALLLDEPLSGLDLASREEVLIFLQSLLRSGMALVMVTHHEGDLPDGLDGVLRMEAGRLESSHGQG